MTELREVTTEQLNEISTIAHFMVFKTSKPYITEGQQELMLTQHDNAINLSWMIIGNLCLPTEDGINLINLAYRTLRSFDYPLVSYNQLIDDLVKIDNTVE